MPYVYRNGRLLDGLEIPAIHVSCVTTAPTAITGFYNQLVAGAGSRTRPDPARSLLPYCSDTRRIPEHAVNVLSDVTTGFKDLVDKVATPEGRRELEGYLGEDAHGIIRFWQEEYPVQ